MSTRPQYIGNGHHAYPDIGPAIERQCPKAVAVEVWLGGPRHDDRWVAARCRCGSNQSFGIDRDVRRMFGGDEIAAMLDTVTYLGCYCVDAPEGQ